MPLEGKVQVFICDECNSKIDGSCARKKGEKIICDSCARKKEDFIKRIAKREEQRWAEIKRKREGS